MDEAQEIAESFLVKQGVDLRTLHADPGGGAAARRGVDARGATTVCALASIRRWAICCVTSARARWTAGRWRCRRAGQIYRVQREQLDDEPGMRLERLEAFRVAVEKLAGDLGIPAYSLNLLSDTLVFQPQRNDWTFTFDWPEALGDSGTFTVTLSGERSARSAFPAAGE